MNDTTGIWDRLTAVYVPLGGAVLVIITVLVVVIVLRWRARDEGQADEFPGGRDERTRVELLYGGLLAVIAAVLVWITFGADTDLNAQFDAPAAVHVKVTGAQWNWRFAYPDDGIVEQGTRNHFPTLTVPAGEPVDFTGTSLDVIHSFWIPDERFKRDVFPGRQTNWQMTFDGEPRMMSGAGHCAEFCGLRHSQMRFNVDVLSPADFQAWEQRHRTAGAGAGASS